MSSVAADHVIAASDSPPPELPPEPEQKKPPPPISNKKKKRCRLCRGKCLHKTLHILIIVKNAILTTFMLLVVNLIYVIIGGLIFSRLESDTGEEAKTHRLEFDNYLQETLDFYDKQQNDYKKVLESYNDTSITDAEEEKKNEELDKIRNISNARLKIYTEKLINVIDNDNWVPLEERGTDETSSDKWSLSNSIFFCITVITCIGFGNTTPNTVISQWVCMVYALVGVPLMIIFIQHLGKNLGALLEFLYFHMTLMGERQPRPWVIRRRMRLEKNRPSRVDNALTKLGNGAEVVFASATTIGEMSNTYDKIAIPIHVCITIIGVYLSFGGLIFSKHGIGTWSFLDALYFSFITMSTIGFGDLVFGQGENVYSSSNFSRQVNLAASIMYIIIGLGLLSMSFDEMTYTFKQHVAASAGYMDRIKQRFRKKKSDSKSVPKTADKSPDKSHESHDYDKESEPLSRDSVKSSTSV